jgi:tripartite-type tricarboxylate transporter receptor subunit TctC
VRYSLPRTLAVAFALLASSALHSQTVEAQSQPQSPAADAKAGADGAAEFYKGRNVSIIVGFSAGGSFDIYARAVSRHIGRHIPGNPTVIVQNMPGAGSLKAVEYLYTVAARDGTVMATFNHTVPIEPLLGRAKFDTRQMAWLGSVASESSVCLASARSGIKSLEEAKSKQVTLGGTGRGSDTDMFASVLRTRLGLPIKLVTGYPGTLEIMLAVQRGEVDGLCGIFYSSLLVGYPEQIAKGELTMLAQAAIAPDPALPGVPMILDLAKTEQQRQILMLLIGPQTMARPYAMPPGSPPARVEVMRRAFAATMTDPAFLAETKNARMPVTPVYPQRIGEILEQLHRTPPDVLAEAIKTFSE